MAVRTPLYYVDPGDGNVVLQEMSQTQLDNIYKQAIKLMGYGARYLGAVTNYKGSFELVQTITKWKLASGTGDDAPNTDDYPAVGELTTSISIFNKVKLHSAPVTFVAPVDTNSVAFPLYYSGGKLRAMTQDDFLDTFCKPAIEKYVDQESGFEGWHYTISTSQSLTGYTMQTDMYQDYYSKAISTKDDERTTVLNNTYYLHKINADQVPTVAYQVPVKTTTGGDVAEFSTMSFDLLLKAGMQYLSQGVDDYRVSYTLGSDIPEDAVAHTQLGTTIQDYSRPTTSTVINYIDTKQAGIADDVYYSLRYPTESIANVSNYKLRIYRY